MCQHRLFSLLLKYSLGILLLFQTIVPLYGQKDLLKPDTFWMGASGGISGSLVSFSPSVDQSIYLGYYAGIEALHNNQNYTALKMQLGVAHRGWKEAYTADSNKKFSMALNYVEATFLSHLYYPIQSIFVGFDLGPSVGYLFNYQQRKEGASFSEQEQHRYAAPINGRFSWGIKGGPVIYLQKGKNTVMLSAHAYYGLHNIYPTKVSDVYSQASEVALTITGSYFFRLK